MPAIHAFELSQAIAASIGVGMTQTIPNTDDSAHTGRGIGAVVAVVNFSSIVWATSFDWLIWNDWPLPIVFVGAAVVIGSNILIVWQEYRLKQSIRAKIPQVP